MTPYNQALLNLLQSIITSEPKRLLEIGSGSGEQALLFALYFKNLIWTTSDKAEKMALLKKVLLEAKLPNIQGPLCFEVGEDEFPKNHAGYNYVFMNEVLPYLTWKQAKGVMKMMGNRLREGSQIFIAGAFKYEGYFRSEAQEALDKKLKEKDIKFGLRSFEDICDCMKKNGFDLYQDFDLPDAQHLLVFTRLERVVLGD